MAHYYFHLHDGTDGVLDLDGIDLPDYWAARREAELIARDLMRHAELQTRHWQLEVRDADNRFVLQMSFVSVDATLAHLDAQTRSVIERGAELWRAFLETRFRSQALVRRSRAIIARGKHKPYLVVKNGHRV